ncbi:MAG: HAMP domain-containing protein, partial [Clostridia bacterium]|nr:HAMP domain-containing protein [Clostridia bacterium]
EAVLIGIAGLALVILILWRVLAFFLKPLESLCRQMGEIAASGDLTSDALVANEAEIGLVATSYNSMLGGLRQILQGMRASAGRLQEWSRQISTGSQEASAAGEELAAIAEQNTIGAEKQVEAIERITETLVKMTEDTKQMAGRAEEAIEVATKALAVTRTGEEYVRNSIQQMHQIGVTNTVAVDKVRTLVERSEEIEKLTRLIAQVADQTNLLALNAAIEAARAGDQGRGFAVVAEEVRKLAEEAADMADKIGGTISEIVRDTEVVARSMEASSQEIDKGIQLVTKAGEAFGYILAEVSEVNGFISDISRLSAELARGSGKVVEGAGSVKELAMEAAGHAGQAAASTEEQAAFLTEMHRLAGDLEKEVLLLEEIVSRFLLEEIKTNCWDEMGCGASEREKCPAYQNEEKRCWLIPHTWCGGKQQGTAEEKREVCMNCRYFQSVFTSQTEA